MSDEATFAAKIHRKFYIRKKAALIKNFGIKNHKFLSNIFRKQNDASFSTDY